MNLMLIYNKLLFAMFILICLNTCATESNNETKYECGKQAIRNSRIVGGNDTYSGEFPWLASILMHGHHHCGGVIISNQWILTAAHCVVGYVPRNFIIRLGAYKIQSHLEDNAIDVPLSSIIIHANYSRPRPFSNDIALLKLREKILYTDFIIPICLPVESDSHHTDLYVNEYGIVVGWGWLQDTGENEFEVEANILQKVRLPIIPNQECEMWYKSRGKFVVISSNQFCAGFAHGGKDACRGDSGGPILIRNATTNVFNAIGIVSAGIGCALPQLPGLYTRVDAFLPWILKYVPEIKSDHQ